MTMVKIKGHLGEGNKEGGMRRLTEELITRIESNRQSRGN